MLKHKEYMRYIFVVFFIFLIYLSYLVIKPFFIAILTSAILAYTFYPIFDKLSIKIKNRSVSAFIVSILIILLLAMPFLFIVNSVTKESQFVYVRAKQIFITGDIFSIGCSPEDTSSVCQLSTFIASFTSRPQVRYHLQSSIERITTAFSQKVSEFVFSIPTMVLGVFVTFFTMFYMFKDGKSVLDKVKKVLPLNTNDQKKVFQKLKETTYAIIYGSLLVAAIQGVIGGVGYFFFGISSPIIWGIFTAIFALIPMVGTAFIWVPLSILLIVQGSTAAGMGLLLYGAIIIGLMDNILKPFIIGKKAGIHPVLIMLGALGGLAIFGFIGFVIGPLILAMFMTFLEIYENEKISNNLRV